jgi:hypothetical protein
MIDLWLMHLSEGLMIYDRSLVDSERAHWSKQPFGMVIPPEMRYGGPLKGTHPFMILRAAT